MSHSSARLADAASIGPAIPGRDDHRHLVLVLIARGLRGILPPRRSEAGALGFGAGVRSGVKLYTRTVHCPRCGTRTSKRRTPPLLRAFAAFLRNSELRHCADCRWSGWAPRNVADRLPDDETALLGAAEWDGGDFSFGFSPEEEEAWVRNVRATRRRG